MSYVIESPTEIERRIAFTIEAKQVNTVLDTTLREYAKDLNINGFRKGKVPHSVIEQRYADDIYNRTTENIINDNINKTLEKEKIHPMNRIQLEDQANTKKVTRDSDFSFTCFFEVLPKVDIPKDFTKFSVDVENSELSAEEVETITNQLRQSMASLEDIEEKRKPKAGDVLLVDVEGSFEGTPVPGMAAQNFLMQLREENKDKEVDVLARTIFVGEEAKGTMICPADYPEVSFRGKNIDILVRLHKIQKQILPEFDAEFAKKIGFDDVEKLHQAITAQATNNKAAKVKSEAQKELLGSILKDLNYTLPESMVQAAVSNYMAEARHHLGKQNMDPEAMVKALADMKTQGEETAKTDTKAHVFLLSVAYNEEFGVTNQEIDMHIRQLAMETKQEYEQVRHHIAQAGMIPEIQERIMSGKALDHIYNQAKKTVVDAKEKPKTASKKPAASEKPAASKKPAVSEKPAASKKPAKDTKNA